MKTAAELGITELEHAALIKTIEVLRLEQIILNMGESCSVNPIYEKYDRDRLEEGEELQPGDDTAKPQPPCGTACCIGGTMSILMQNGMELPERITPEMGFEAEKYVWSNDANNGSKFDALFWSVTDEKRKPAEGIAAIERFLDGNTSNPWLLT